MASSWPSCSPCPRYIPLHKNQKGIVFAVTRTNKYPIYGSLRVVPVEVRLGLPAPSATSSQQHSSDASLYTRQPLGAANGGSNGMRLGVGALPDVGVLVGAAGALPDVTLFKMSISRLLD